MYVICVRPWVAALCVAAAVPELYGNESDQRSGILISLISSSTGPAPRQSASGTIVAMGGFSTPSKFAATQSSVDRQAALRLLEVVSSPSG
jgi:hypothetical protein